MNEIPSCDWSRLPVDMLICVFRRLDIPDLVRSGAVCQSWNIQYLLTRRLGLCSENQSPFVIYASQDGDPYKATLRNLSTSKLYHIPLPDPPFRTRYTVGSSHGWLVVADEQSELFLLNPITGAQIELPPLRTLKPVRFSFRKTGELVGHAIYNKSRVSTNPDRLWVPRLPVWETRYMLYLRAVLSCDPSEGNCVVMLIHNPLGQISFARVGDSAWTWLSEQTFCLDLHDCIYDHKDGLFYILGDSGDLYTFDPNGQTSVVNFILDPFELCFHCTKYLVRAPWGDLLQVWRYYYNNNDEHEEFRTIKVVVYKVDLVKEELVRLKDLQGHTVFVGFCSSFFGSAEDFPMLSPNCVYLGHDNAKCGVLKKSILKEVMVFNMEDDSFIDLSPPPSSFMNCPPVWFRPSFPLEK